MDTATNTTHEATAMIDTFAFTAAEVATAYSSTPAKATAVLRRLEKVGRVSSVHVNGEREITWQSEAGAGDDTLCAEIQHQLAGVVITATKPGRTHSAPTGKFAPRTGMATTANGRFETTAAACPVCGNASGQQCTGKNGTARTWVHTARPGSPKAAAAPAAEDTRTVREQLAAADAHPAAAEAKAAALAAHHAQVAAARAAHPGVAAEEAVIIVIDAVSKVVAAHRAKAAAAKRAQRAAAKAAWGNAAEVMANG